MKFWLRLEPGKWYHEKFWKFAKHPFHNIQVEFLDVSGSDFDDQLLMVNSWQSTIWLSTIDSHLNH